MTIKHLYPATRPSLDLNFAATKRLDPRITFSRASTGTYVDANGLIQTAATNTARFDHNPTTGESLGLLVEAARTNTITYSSIGLADVNTQRYAGVAPDGTFTAALITNNNLATGYRNSPGAGTFTYSVFVKQGTSTTFRMFYAGYGDTDWTFTFSTETLVVAGAWTNARVEKYPNGWYKLSATSSARDLYYYYFAADLTTSTVFFWGAQVEAGAFPTSYIPTPATFTGRTSTATFYDSAGTIQTVASGVARSNAFFPDSNGVMRSAGLLLEAAGTNLLQQSEAIGTSPWTLVNSASVTANSASAPDGLTTANTLSGTTTSSYAEQTIPWTASGNWTLSFFAKAGTSNRSKVAIVRSSSQVHGTSIDWSFGVPSFSTTFGCTPQSEKLANGWYRISLLLTSVVHTATNSLTVTSDFISGTGTVFLWGFQAEQNAFPTSYIPTVASTVTRSADTSTSATVTRSDDLASMLGTNFSSWFAPNRGTFFVNWSVNGEDGSTDTQTPVSLSTPTNNAFVGFLNYDERTTVGFTRPSFAQISIFNNLTGRRLKGATAFEDVSTNNTSASSAIDGTLYNANATQNYALNGDILANGGFDRLGIGRQIRSITTYQVINGCISRITYWPTRLSDAIIQSLTR